FFKNPILEINKVDELKNNFPDIKLFKEDETHMKVPAGWLIENVGLKGKSFGNISVYSKNAMILVNNCEASFKDLVEARDEIIKTVKDKFGITLEQEPEIL
ncbi:MAG: UDP-N-acetylmuramate dehydrogenase, partial [Candidatus Paceibacterota bacterium]